MATTTKNSTTPAKGAPAVGNDAIDILENDHENVKALFAQLADAEDAGARTEILEQLKALLTIHNATEENLVYPAVRVAAHRPKDADTLYHQQDEAKVGIWEIDSMLKGTLDDAGIDAKIEKLQSAVLAHVRKEEETEFPHLRDALKGKGLKQLTEAVREFRSSFRFEGNA
jgi:hemerythrin superfamily protein